MNVKCIDIYAIRVFAKHVYAKIDSPMKYNCDFLHLFSLHKLKEKRNFTFSISTAGDASSFHNAQMNNSQWRCEFALVETISR